MKYVPFAGSDVLVSRIGFGAMGLGGSFGRQEDGDFIRGVLHSLDKGVNLIDTARIYGPSESLIGKALKQWKGPRPFIATKALSQEPLGWGTSVPVNQAYPQGAITKSVEASLNALGLDAIDLVQMHQYWPDWDFSDYWMEELIALKERGHVRFIGISLPDHRHDLATHIVQSGQIDSIQTIVNIFDPLAFDSLVPLCQRANIAVIARCILDEGGLTGFLTHDTVLEDGDFRQLFFGSIPRDMYMQRVERLRKYIPAYADTLAELAIKFVTTHPGITTALTSMHISAYADENIAAMDRPELPEFIFEDIRRHHRWVRNFYEAHYW